MPLTSIWKVKLSDTEILIGSAGWEREESGQSCRCKSHYLRSGPQEEDKASEGIESFSFADFHCLSFNSGERSCCLLDIQS